jgi:uncharacterized protein (TIGR03067 family)
MHVHLLLGLLLALDVPAPSAEAEFGIEGDWVVESWCKNGEVDNASRGLDFTFREGKFTLLGVTGDYAVLPPWRPRAIDLYDYGVEAPPFRAIYKVERGRLTLCVTTERDGPRPAWFTAEREEPFELVVLKRARK